LRKGEGTHRAATARSACLPVILEESWAGRAAWEDSRRRADHSMPGTRAATTRTPAFEAEDVSLERVSFERDETKRARRSHANFRGSRRLSLERSEVSRDRARSPARNSNPNSLAPRTRCRASRPFRTFSRAYFLYFLLFLE